MLSYIQKIKKARESRLAGKSLSEIAKEIHVSRSSLSVWLKDIVLTDDQVSEMKKRVAGKMSRGRLNALIKIRSKRIYQEKKIYDEAQKEFVKLSKDPLFMTGLALYLANGTKKGNSFQFSNDDHTIINLMILWAKKYLNIDEKTLKIRDYGSYKRLDISRISILRRVISWQKLLISYMMEQCK